MKPTQVLQEIRKMRFEDAYEGWNAGRLTQAEAARILGVCERSFRRYMGRYEANGLDGLIDRRVPMPVSGMERQALSQFVQTHGRYAQLHLGQKASTESRIGPQDREARSAPLTS